MPCPADVVASSTVFAEPLVEPIDGSLAPRQASSDKPSYKNHCLGSQFRNMKVVACLAKGEAEK